MEDLLPLNVLKGRTKVYMDPVLPRSVCPFGPQTRIPFLTFVFVLVGITTGFFVHVVLQ